MKNNIVVTFKPIGVIHSEHIAAEQTPIQPVYAAGCRGRAEIFPEYAAGLRDLEGFSHIYLIYYLHQAAPGSAHRQAVSPRCRTWYFCHSNPLPSQPHRLEHCGAGQPRRQCAST